MAQLESLSKKSAGNWSDWMGVVASVACAIHCAAMPFIAVFLPVLGLSFLMDDAFHKVMVVVCSTLAIAAFIPGFRRHRQWLPICIGAIGLSLISTAAFALEDNCCASCALAASGGVEISNVASDVEIEVASEFSIESVATGARIEAAEVCTEACCNSEAAASTQSNSTAGPIESESFLGMLTPWITSLGGLLLVAAHLTNRQFSCRCGCCPVESSTSVVELG